MSWHSRDRLFGKLLPILFLLTTIILILVFASSLSTVRFSPGGDLNMLSILLGNLEWPTMPRVAPEAVSSETAPLGWMRLVFWVLLAMTLSYAVVSPRYRRFFIRTLLLVLLLIFVTERLQDRMRPAEEEGLEGAGLGQVPETRSPVELPPPPDFVSSTPEWAAWTINLLFALAIVLLAWFLWKRLRPKPAVNEQDAVIREARSALDELEAGGDLHEVILRCYAQMSRTMGVDRNVYRHQAMTPRDFEAHLASRGFQDEHIGRLTRLFETVRYSSSDPGPEAEAEAIACLTAIVNEYGSNARRASLAESQPVGAAP